MCNAACGTICLLTSIFAIVVLSAMGLLIRDNYKYIGEWYPEGDEIEGTDLLPNQEYIDNASKGMFIAAGVYAGFVLLSLGCIGVGSRRK